MDYSSRILLESMRLQGKQFAPPVEFVPRIWYNPDLVTSKFLIPGLIGLILADGYDRARLGHDLQTIVEQVKVMSRLIDSMGRLTSYKTKTYGDDIRIVDLERSAQPEE
jgi:hypothetical protein